LYPWLDDGSCVVKQASERWAVLVERCFFALDVSRIQFRDVEHRCPVAQVDAATMAPIVGMCLMAQPELIVAAVGIIGVVVVAAAIAAELRKLPCQCICFGIDDRTGQRHGPYPIDRKRNASACNEDCLKVYNGGGKCRE